MEKFTQAPVGLDIDQTVSSNSQAITNINAKTFSEPANNTNFNNMTTAGAYRFSWIQDGTSYNRPVSTGGLLIVGTGYLIVNQQYTDANGRVFTRGYNNGSWSSWLELVRKDGVEYLTITPETGIVIDSNRSNICGDHGVIAVTCHATQNLGNHGVFSFDKVSKAAERSSIYVVGTGERWTVTGVAYGYLADHSISINGITNGTYYHIYFPFTKES